MDFDFSPVDSVEKVPEQFRALYAQDPNDEGKYTVADGFKPVAEALNGFNRTTRQLRQDLKTKAVDLTPLSEFGDSPDKIAETIRAKITEASQSKNTDVNKAVEAAKAGMTEAHKRELEAREGRNKALQDQLYGLMVENAATAAVAEQKGVPELMMPFIKNQVKVTEENGEFRVHVVDPAGEVRYGATGAPMTIKELVAEMKANERFGRLFESETPAGGGAHPGGAARPGVRQPAPKERNANDKIAAGLAARARRR